jgi:outer membrane immunogenic protein
MGDAMKTYWLTILGLAGLGVAPAFAADLPARTYTKAPPPVAVQPSWAGFYVGANGGASWSNNCWDFTNAFGVFPVPATREGCQNATGGIVGGQFGYRWQAAQWVFGLEAQGDWADLKGSSTSFILGPPAVTNQTRTDAIGLFTGQIGFAWNDVLGYVKGGAAVTHNKYNGLVAGVVGDQASDTRWGGAIGAGIEFGFAPGWSLALEFDHLFMGRRDVTLTAVGPVAATTRIDSIKQEVDMATLRVNYRFGGPELARY